MVEQTRSSSWCFCFARFIPLFRHLGGRCQSRSRTTDSAGEMGCFVTAKNFKMDPRKIATQDDLRFEGGAFTLLPDFLFIYSS